LGVRFSADKQRRSDPAPWHGLRKSLPDREGGDAAFTEEDEEIVTLLASQAAVAIENARLYEAATRWSRQLESLNEVGNAMAAEIEPQAILDLVARRLHALIDARILTIWLPTRDGKLRVDTVSGDGAEGLARAPDRCLRIENWTCLPCRPQRTRRFGSRRS